MMNLEEILARVADLDAGEVWPISHHETFSATIQPPYTSTKG